ncbi:hypothetical protein B0T26DRAFT_870939 [Lasiosphaeria miniovina]|uniref:Glycine-rich cell wall structural protein 1 n=1 Tax=Lasiosphaeria miniovina TaxID=1954250 RepID=A0AA40AVU9_9PEZI|nr:uncharacterized protein B0T26DRAFT_870939 [Lasiosphaeria miniovina]KAK0722987.1 hypothetical protein B0T26DRAFT_870939 [Lasiosphaeria miniovina]
METINNMASAAANKIWGTPESKEEPISGRSGNVGKGEPYDAEHKEYTDDAPSTPSKETPAPTTSSTSKLHSELPTHAAVLSDMQPKDPNPTTVKDSSVATAGDSTKAQNDVRDPADPATHHDKAAAKENVDDTTDGLDVGDNPDKLDGPGPRPLEDVARDNGGDAAKASRSDTKVATDADSSEDGPQSTSHGEGTGEQYVKSSGLKADGGNFDASVPGAGREADRLLEEKGVHKDGPNGGIVPNTNDYSGSTATPAVHTNGSAAHPSGSSPTSPTKEKTSLKTKIKAKLHIHSSSSTAE